MLTFGSRTLTYDANGNLTNDGTNTYTWDARNRLASMTGASFVYDGLGRRVNKTINGNSTSFLYDGQNPVQELAGKKGTANLLTGLGIDEYLMRTDRAGARSFLTDALGSTLALTDTAGTVQTQYTYEPFGNTAVTGQTNANPFQYTGRENDGTGLYYYRARYYSFNTQRFISQDPYLHPMFALCQGISSSRSVAVDRLALAGIRNTLDINMYAYVSNNPIRYRDPFGLDKNCNDCIVLCACEGAACFCTENACGNITLLGIYLIFPPPAPYSFRLFSCSEFYSAPPFPPGPPPT